MNQVSYLKRIKNLQSSMQAANIDIMLLVDRENLIYFSGIEQVECMAIVVPQEGEAQGTTLSLDADWVQQNCALDKVRGYHFPDQSLAGSVIEIIKEMGYIDPVIGFERYFVGFAVFDALRKSFDPAKFVNASEIIYRLRAIKDPEEIEKIRQASRAVCAGLEAALKVIKPGVREIDIAAEAEYAAMKAGSQGTPFRTQVVSGRKTLITHPFSDTKEVQAGEIVLLHIGAKYQGYIAKMCRTVAVGKIPEEQKHIYGVLQESQRAGIAALKHGVPAKEIDRVCREVVHAYGYGDDLFLDIIGYGMGLRQSEFYPMIGKPFPYPLLKNMVVDILLPSIYKPVVGGPRLTDTILIKEDSAQVLTNYPSDLIQI